MPIHTTADTRAMITTSDFGTVVIVVSSGCEFLGEFNHRYIEALDVEGMRAVLTIASEDVSANAIERATALNINNAIYAVRDIDQGEFTTDLILELTSNA